MVDIDYILSNLTIKQDKMLLKNVYVLCRKKSCALSRVTFRVGRGKGRGGHAASSKTLLKFLVIIYEKFVTQKAEYPTRCKSILDVFLTIKRELNR